MLTSLQQFSPVHSSDWDPPVLLPVFPPLRWFSLVGPQVPSVLPGPLSLVGEEAGQRSGDGGDLSEEFMVEPRKLRTCFKVRGVGQSEMASRFSGTRMPPLPFRQ